MTGLTVTDASSHRRHLYLVYAASPEQDSSAGGAGCCSRCWTPQMDDLGWQHCLPRGERARLSPALRRAIYPAPRLRHRPLSHGGRRNARLFSAGAGGSSAARMIAAGGPLSRPQGRLRCVPFRPGHAPAQLASVQGTALHLPGIAAVPRAATRTVRQFITDDLVPV